jgi:hypothetical protein
MRRWRTTKDENRRVPQNRRNEYKGLAPIFRAARLLGLDPVPTLSRTVHLDVTTLRCTCPFVQVQRVIGMICCAQSEVKNNGDREGHSRLTKSPLQ